MTKHNKILLALGLSSVAFGLTGCPTDPVPTDAPGTDVPSIPTDTNGEDAPVATGGCATYCTQMNDHCSGANAQYDDMAECMAYCAAAGWPEGTPGEAGGNTLACRIYHSGDPAMGDPVMHCPHAGPSGAGVCGAAVTFRTDAASAYTRVDRMGMPAVATALVSSTMRNAYNDDDPSDDVALTYAGELLGTLTGLHAALDDDLIAAGVTPCSMTMPSGLPECVSQEVAPGVTVASLVIPDTLNINPAAPSGFPNGRELDDEVIDPTLSLIFLRLGASCGDAPCGPGTLNFNPNTNDVGFPISTTFPYLAPIHPAP